MNPKTEFYGNLIVNYAKENYRECFREPDGLLKHPFIVPGSCYANELWDWDSWLTDLALREIAAPEEIEVYEKGCVLNFLEHVDAEGRMPIFISPRKTALTAFGEGEKNIHKPCLAQHALLIAGRDGNAEWLRDKFDRIGLYLGWYDRFCLHESGLYVWLDDFAIGVDNDPCTFYRPPKSSGSIYLNCLMYMELLAAAQLAGMLGKDDTDNRTGPRPNACGQPFRNSAGMSATAFSIMWTPTCCRWTKRKICIRAAHGTGVPCCSA